MMFDGKVKGMRNVNLSGKKTKIEQNNNKTFLENARIQRELRAIERLKHTSAIRIQAKYRRYIVCKKLYIDLCYQFDQNILECNTSLNQYNNFNMINDDDDDDDDRINNTGDDKAMIIIGDDKGLTVDIQNKIMKLIQLIIILYHLKHHNSTRLIQLNRLLLSIMDMMNIISSTPSYDLSFSVYHPCNRRIFMMMKIYRYNLNILLNLFLSTSAAAEPLSASSLSIRSDDINVILSFLSLFINESSPPSAITTTTTHYTGVSNDNHSSRSSSSSSSYSNNNDNISRSIIINHGLIASVGLLITSNQLNVICFILRSMILFKYKHSGGGSGSGSSSIDDLSNSNINNNNINELMPSSSPLPSSLDRFISMLIQILHNSISFQSIKNSYSGSSSYIISSSSSSSSSDKQHDIKNYEQVSSVSYIYI